MSLARFLIALVAFHLSGASSVLASAPPAEPPTTSAVTVPDPGAETPAPAPSVPATPSSSRPERVRILALDLETTTPLPEARAINDLIAVELGGDERLEVVSGAEVRRLAELEASKQSIGCAESTCLAEIAGAMGAEFVLFGQIARLGESLLVTMQLFDAGRAVAAGRVSVQERSAERLPAVLAPALQELTRPLLRARFGDDAELKVRPTIAIAPPAPGLSTAGVVALGGTGAVVVGVAAVLVGAIPGSALRGLSDRWFSSGATDVEALEEARGWQQWYPAADVLQIGGAALVAGGLLTTAGGAAWALFVRESP